MAGAKRVHRPADAAQLRAPTKAPSPRVPPRDVFWITISTLALGATIWLLRMYARQPRANHKLVALNNQLKIASSQVQELQGLLPICAQCKSIRDDEGYWHRIESYLPSNSKASLTHGICPGCAVELYPDLLPELMTKPNRDLKADA